MKIIQEYVKYDDAYNLNDIDNFKNECENIELVCALESLSDIELTVIFLLYKKQLTSQEASKILKICSDSVTRIKRRAFKKIEKYLKGEN